MQWRFKSKQLKKHIDRYRNLAFATCDQSHPLDPALKASGARRTLAIRLLIKDNILASNLKDDSRTLHSTHSEPCRQNIDNSMVN